MLLLLIVALATGGWIAARPSVPRSDVQLWTFSQTHADDARAIFSASAGRLGYSVSVEQMSDRAENLRLQSIFLDPPSDRSVVPDLVEIEINQLGRFFRPPIEEIGLLPLNDLLAAAGLKDQFHAARLATWSKQGVVFGLPLDVHPVALAYRSDLFAEAGVELSQVRTWGEFQSACLAFQDYFRKRGQTDRWAMELSRSSSDMLSVLLLQQHIDLIDADGRPAINTPKTVDTLAFYAGLVAGPQRIGLDTGSPSSAVQDVLAGRVAVFLMPDWRVQEFKARYPQLSGKLRLLPLPRFASTDAPTASWGGTMIGIPRSAPRPERAWAAMQSVLTSPVALKMRKEQGILSAIPNQWPSGEMPDAYFGGQDAQTLFVSLARQQPSPIVNAQTVIARAELSVALSAAVMKIGSGGGAATIRDNCQRWLDWAAADLSNRLAQSRLAS